MAGKREIRLLVAAGLPGGLRLGVPSDSGLESLTVGGREYRATEFLSGKGQTGDGKERYELSYYPCGTEALDIVFSTVGGKPFELTVASLADVLAPAVEAVREPEGTSSQNDSTSVVRTFKFR